MKGGLAAIVHAARPAAEAGARIGLVIVPDEETGGRLGAERLAGLGRLDGDAAGAIVAEPTWGTIWHACRGAFTVRVRVRVRPAHVGLHYEGVNAFAAAVDVGGPEPFPVISKPEALDRRRAQYQRSLSRPDTGRPPTPSSLTH
jgi:succinyl-diaminopimelate desuccinylase